MLLVVPWCWQLGSNCYQGRGLGVLDERSGLSRVASISWVGEIILSTWRASHHNMASGGGGKGTNAPPITHLHRVSDQGHVQMLSILSFALRQQACAVGMRNLICTLCVCFKGSGARRVSLPQGACISGNTDIQRPFKSMRYDDDKFILRIQ